MRWNSGREPPLQRITWPSGVWNFGASPEFTTGVSICSLCSRHSISNDNEGEYRLQFVQVDQCPDVLPVKVDVHGEGAQGIQHHVFDRPPLFVHWVLLTHSWVLLEELLVQRTEEVDHTVGEHFLRVQHILRRSARRLQIGITVSDLEAYITCTGRPHRLCRLFVHEPKEAFWCWSLSIIPLMVLALGWLCSNEHKRSRYEMFQPAAPVLQTSA